MVKELTVSNWSISNGGDDSGARPGRTPYRSCALRIFENVENVLDCCCFCKSRWNWLYYRSKSRSIDENYCTIMVCHQICMIQNWQKLTKISQNLLKLTTIGQTWSACAKMDQNWLKLIKTNQNCPKLTKTGQHWPNLANICQILPILPHYLDYYLNY